MSKHKGETAYMIQREIMKSATMPCGVSDSDLRNVEEVMASYLAEKQSKAEIENQKCRFKYEVIRGVYNIRVNLYEATDKDFLMVGYLFAQMQLLKDWRIK